MKSRMIFVTALVSALSFSAFAQAPATPNIDQRQANQERRIEQGEKSGALTARESQRLERQEGHIDQMEAKAKSDGVVTGKERARLEHAENVESRRIYRQKHDAQHDFNHDGKVDHPRRLRK